MTKPAASPEPFIVPLLMNGLQGRMLYIPPPKNKKRELLLVYGQHASLEHWWPLALELNRYSAVTMPDLPGFGGMQSLSRLHTKPTLDSLADYLSAFVKLRYKNKRLSIVCIGFGQVLVTRMLQRYPDLAKKVNVVVGFGGIARFDDLKLGRIKRIINRLSLRLAATRLVSGMIKLFYLQPWILRKRFSRMAPEAAAEEVALWRTNDLRTHYLTTLELVKLDNCQQQINRPLWYVSTPASKKVENHRLIQHLGVIYSDVFEIRSRIRNDAVGTVSYGRNKAQLLPAKLRRALAAL